MTNVELYVNLMKEAGNYIEKHRNLLHLRYVLNARRISLREVVVHAVLRK